MDNMVGVEEVGKGMNYKNGLRNMGMIRTDRRYKVMTCSKKVLVIKKKFFKIVSGNVDV